MSHPTDRSKLPADFTELPVNEALRVLLRAHLFDIENLAVIEAKHKALAEYIEAMLQTIPENGD